LHQIQGLGPVILKVNDIVLTQSILTRVFGLEHFAEYTPNAHANFKIQVFRIDDGGFVGERHVHASEEEILMQEHGILEQIEYGIEYKSQLQKTIEELESIGIPYQTLDQEDERSLRITEKSGSTFILTLETS